MKYVYIFQKDVATVMFWDWNNPFEWRIMYGGEILFDFDSQKAFIAGDEAMPNGHRRRQAGGGFLRKFNVFSKIIIHVSENTIWASYMSGEIEGGLT